MSSSILTEFERGLFQLFFDLYPQWEHALIEQIRLSNLQRVHDLSNYSVYFTGSGKAVPIKINKKMPVEIILGGVEITDNNVINNIKGHNLISPCPISIPDNNAVGVRIYFCDGFLSELEVYSLSGNPIGIDFPLNGQRTYIIF